jgi:regulator of replication initiation timing
MEINKGEAQRDVSESRKYVEELIYENIRLWEENFKLSKENVSVKRRVQAAESFMNKWPRSIFAEVLIINKGKDKMN